MLVFIEKNLKNNYFLLLTHIVIEHFLFISAIKIMVNILADGFFIVC